MAMASVGKRKAERRGCQVKAQVIRPDRADPIDCLILDFSSTGARVKLSAQTELPPRFKLYIPSRPETKSVILRWARGLEFGVEYSTGVADEKTIYELIDRVAKLERAEVPGVDRDAFAMLAQRIESLEARDRETPVVTDRGGVDRETVAALEESVAQVANAAEGFARRAEQSLGLRIDQVEERLRAFMADAAEQFERRVDAMEARIDALQASSAAESARVADAEVLAALKQSIAESAEVAENYARRVEQSLAARIDETEDRLRTRVAPDVAERLARLEAIVEDMAAAPAPPPDGIDPAGPDPRIVSRIADLEAKLMAPPRAASQLDGAALEAKIEQTARRAEERADRVERFLMTRLDDLETQMISAPEAPAAARAAELADLEFKLHEVAARVEDMHLSSARAATAAAPEELGRLVERISDLEVSVMELRVNRPDAEAATDDDLARRIAEIEGRHGEIVATLRNLLALLSASEARRVAS